MFSGEVNVRIATECKAVDWVIVLSLPPTAKAGGLPLDTCQVARWWYAASFHDAINKKYAGIPPSNNA